MLYIIASPDVVNRSQMRHFKKPHDRFLTPQVVFSLVNRLVPLSFDRSILTVRKHRVLIASSLK